MMKKFTLNLKLKTLLVGIIAANIALVTSCNDEPDGPEPVSIDAEVSNYSVEAGGSITFTDNSTGVVSRTWSFPGGNPETSTEAIVDVTFSKEGPITSSLHLELNDETTEDLTFPIQVGTESFAWSIFSLEDDELAGDYWKTWSPNSTAWDGSVATFNIVTTGGAEGTTNAAKITIASATGDELQIFTKDNDADINGKMDKSKSYVLSFWAKAEGTVSIANVALENAIWDWQAESWAGSEQAWNNYLWSDAQTITSSWKEYTFDIDPSGQPYEEAKNVYVMFKLVPESTGVLYLDEVSLKEK